MEHADKCDTLLTTVKQEVEDAGSISHDSAEYQVSHFDQSFNNDFSMTPVVVKTEPPDVWNPDSGPDLPDSLSAGLSNDDVKFRPSPTCASSDTSTGERETDYREKEEFEIQFKMECDIAAEPQVVQNIHGMGYGKSTDSAWCSVAKAEVWEHGIESQSDSVHKQSTDSVTMGGCANDRVKSEQEMHSTEETDDPRELKQRKKGKSNRKSWQCLQCPVSFPCVSHLNRHLLSHGEYRPHACSICQAKFKLQCHLKQHMSVHTGNRPYSCQECQATFLRSDHLKQHILTHRGLRPYLCTVCDTAFTQAAHLRKHMIRHKDDRVVMCKIKACKAVFTSVSALQKHRQLHEEDRKCKECNVVLSRADDMKKHMRIHTKDKPFVCKVCPARFTQAAHLSTHTLQHTGENPFSCSICGSCFRQNHHLKRHMAVHEGNHPYSCPVCDASFKRGSCLTKHQQKCHK